MDQNETLSEIDTPPSLSNLVVLGTWEVTILMTDLVRTPDPHSVLQPRTPGLKQSSSNSCWGTIPQ